jgi:hypothetical protein
MTTPEQLAEFLSRRLDWSRMAFQTWPSGWSTHPSPWPRTRPTPEQLAKELFADAEFRALKLGSWLGTPDGKLFAEAIEMVTPLPYRTDVELLLAALTLVARAQQRERVKAVGAIALAGLVVVALIAMFTD